MLEDFESLDALQQCMTQQGVTRLYCKLLSENDNSKQQIYLGGSFEVLKVLHFGNVRAENAGKVPNFKADVPLYWLNGNGESALAPGAQLILYPKYPEVRLSGFLKNCSLAPSKNLQPVPKEDRKTNNGPDGRILFFGVSVDKVFAYLAIKDSSIAREIESKKLHPALEEHNSPLKVIITAESTSSRILLLTRLKEIHEAGWHESIRLDKFGARKSYVASNGGGYTLEALFNIIPNGKSAPDFKGWEIKAHSTSKITLMTPEPNAGFYGEHGVEAFLRKYGYETEGDKIYFTGAHRANVICKASKHTLTTNGFDLRSGKISDVCGGIQLIDPSGNISAEWTFNGLIEHWGRKHTNTAYVPYIKSPDKPINYKYSNKILLGVGTEFEMFLKALINGAVIYDPAPKIEAASTTKSKTKARNQFRISVKDLTMLYKNLEEIIV